MSEWEDMSIRGLLFQWASTIKIQLSKVCWSSTKLTSSLFHWKLTCSRHDIAEKLLSWHWTTITHSLTNLYYIFKISKRKQSWFLLARILNTQSLKNFKQDDSEAVNASAKHDDTRAPDSKKNLLVPNRNDKSRSHLDELQVSLSCEFDSPQ